ncbi:MAG: pentapeptide repeat-containing protein [Cyanobacteriota bacterium]|nr:pentapeptide repeat-containing protein [Cyanobacteriota bacterium]
MKKVTGKVAGKNLTQQDFSGYDLRGVNFKNADLTSVNLSDSRAGLTSLWRWVIILAALFLSFLAGIILVYSGRMPGYLIFFDQLPDAASEPLQPISEFGWITIVALVLSFTIIIRHKKPKSLIIFITIIFASSVIFTLLFVRENPDEGSIGASIFFSFLSYFGILAGFAILTGVIITLAIATEKAKMTTILIITSLFTTLGAILGTIIDIEAPPLIATSWVSTISALAVAISMSYRILSGKQKESIFKSLALTICSKFGTNFQGANLTDANLTGAILGNSDFRGANLTRTCWLKAQNIEESRIEGTYLEDDKIGQLLVSGNGQDQNFDGLDLRGCHLKNANLIDASFIATKLSEATLENANLLRAKLVKTQLYQTNLTGANLTGACIQDWGISTDTQFTNVQCEYVYMRLETREDPDPWRKPDNRNETFKPGDFNDFIAPIIKTQKLYQTQNLDLREVAENYKILDLFHYEGINPTAATAALQKLIEKYPEAGLKVVAMEGQKDDKIRVQAQVKGNFDRSILSSEYAKLYEQLKTGSDTDLQAFMASVAEKDKQIQQFQGLLENAIKQPKFYVETYHEEKGNITISDVQGDISGVAAAGENQSMTNTAMGEISGKVTSEINQSTESTEPS